MTALLPSIEWARAELRPQGPTLDEKTVHRMARQLGAEVLTARTRQLQQFRDDQFPAEDDLVGRHVVAQADGGRVRIRTQIETKKRKGVKHRRKIRIEWREPKLLILDLSDRRGRMLKGTRPWIDGTMQQSGRVRSGNRITFRFAERSGIIDYNVIWQPSLLVMDVEP